MADAFEPTAQSPLSDMQAPSAGVEIAECGFTGKINLRGDPDDPDFLSSVQSSLGLALPLEPNSFTEDDKHTVFWLGPDEWLIHCVPDERHRLLGRLRESLGEIHSAATDVSDYYLVIRVSGEKARELLSKGTPFDVHPDVFNPGACAQTVFGHASVLLSCVDDTPTFDLQLRWSFAEYVWMYLLEGTREYEAT